MSRGLFLWLFLVGLMVQTTTTTASMQEAIRRVVGGGDLSADDAHCVASAFLEQEVTPAQLGALLVALRMKGESGDEILGFTRAMREHMVRVPIGANGVIDTCGTGGDGAGTFNISTVSAFVAAGAGCRVAKHGNRAVSGRCGSADLLDTLGVPFDMSAEQAAASIRRTGIAFLFAPRFHPSLKHAAEARREIGVRSILNIVGPLANPAGAHRQLIGVFDGRLTEPMARTLARLGSEHSLVVHGHEGLDEISLSGPTRVTELRGGSIHTSVVTPEQFGVTRAPLSVLCGDDTAGNAEVALSVLDGRTGPARDVVALNAGAAVYVSGLAATLAQGVGMALESIGSGRARRKLDELRQTGGSAER
jgi:anthranilate phosphoribosyltransferase